MKRLLSVCLCLTVLLGCMAHAGETQMKIKDKGRGIIPEEQPGLPEQDWQKHAAFPDWKDHTDDTLAMNSMLSFTFYHGQGVLWLDVAEEVEQFSLYINGEKFDTSEFRSGVWPVDFSEAAADGVNTLQISNILPVNLENAVEVYIPYPEVLLSDGDLEGIQPQTLQLIDDLITSDIEYGFTGAQLAVVRNGRLVYENAWGKTNSYAPDGTPLQDSPAVTTQTLYDLASVTKMFTVNYAVQKLVTDEKLDIETPVVDILGDEFAENTLGFRYMSEEEKASWKKGDDEDAGDAPDHETQISWKRELTVRDILCHQAGFPAGPHYNDPDYDMSLQDRGEEGSNLCFAVNREQMLEAVCKTPLLYEPGTQTVYSDVDYMLLTFIIEKVTGRRLDDYMKESFFEPLELEHITFLPLENGFTKDDCAATELNGNTRDGHVSFQGIRTETIQGEVHDERAWYCMEGVSGHAGLFSDAADLAKLAYIMLTGGYGGHRFFSRNVMDTFTSPKALAFSNWGLGWWREGDDQRVWYFGTQSAPETIGHQGWTGTMVMIDPSRNLVVVYLTNKINSPVLGPDALNSFAGGCYTASTLGFVPQILSIGMDTQTDITGQLSDLAADMAAESRKLIPEDADEDHPYVKNAMSKEQVADIWKHKAGIR